MKIRILGTGYGECKIKRAASKDARHRGGVIVNSKILIDAPADIFAAAEDLGLSDVLEEISLVIISHSHEGHFSPEAIARLGKRKRISVLADRELLALIPESENIGKYPILPYREIELGGGCKIIPLPASHKTENPRETALNFIISDDKNLLYALDTSLINCQYLAKLEEMTLDAVILDTAEELKPPTEKLLSHGSLATALMLRGILAGLKLTSDKTKFILSHIPTNKKRSIHTELLTATENTGMVVAYDGYYLNI